MKPTKFTIRIPDDRVEDMKRRLGNTAWAEDYGNEGWFYGVERGWLVDMVRYWRDEFDWRAQEAQMNRYPHYRVEIDGIPIHFIHIRGKGRNPTPLILSHGWPWTFWDWQGVLDPLTDPEAHGAAADDAFDLVVPSLPGFAFSAPLRTQGINVRRIGQLWTTLMRDVLGYRRFAAAGGDWGALITAELGHAHADHLLGIHLGIPILPGVAQFDVPPDSFAPDEAWMARRMAEAEPTIRSHMAVQTTEPQTLAYALADSPAGLAAWMWTRRRNWSDCQGDVVGLFGRDFLCTTASIYWLTNTIASSMRIYRDHFATPWPTLHDRQPSIPVPTGFAVSPKELLYLPRSVAERRTNLKRWTLFAQGGHFAAAEHPGQLVDDYRAFFGALR